MSYRLSFFRVQFVCNPCGNNGNNGHNGQNNTLWTLLPLNGVQEIGGFPERISHVQ